MNGFDPKSSNVSGQYPQQNQTQKADGSRKLTIQGKKTNVSRPRKWLNKLVSALFGKKIRHTPSPGNQPAKAKGTPIRERTASLAKTSDNPYIGRPLPPTPESAKPAKQTKVTDLPKIYSLDQFSENLENGIYAGPDNNTDRNLAKQHLRHLDRESFFSSSSYIKAYNELPDDIKTLVQEVRAEKEVTFALTQSAGPKQDRMIESFRNKLLERDDEHKDTVLKELDRQLGFSDRCSSAYKALDQIPHDLQEEFVDFKDPERPLTKQEKDVQTNYNNQRRKDPKLKNVFDPKNNPQHEQFGKQANPKYRDIPCDIESCAGRKGNYVHANYVRLSEDPDETPYIASQGPTEKNIHHFAHMINDTGSRVSVCLVSKNELDPENPTQRKRTVSLGPKEIGSEENYTGVKVKLADQHFLDGDKVRIDKLEIDGKTHFRVYDTGWEDHTSGTPSRLAALAVVVEQLKQEPELSGYEDSPMVVNCNAGVGRTGTFITLSKSTRDYLRDGTVNTDLDSSIHNARKTRKAFVQTPGQYNVLKALHKDLPSVLDPLIDAAGLKNQNTQSLPPEKKKGPAVEEKPKPQKQVSDTNANSGAEKTQTEPPPVPPRAPRVRPQPAPREQSSSTGANSGAEKTQTEPPPVPPHAPRVRPQPAPRKQSSSTGANSGAEKTQTTKKKAPAIAPKPNSRKPQTGLTASQLMSSFKSGYYHDQPDFWAAFERDLSTVGSSSQLTMLKNEFSEYAKSHPNDKDQTDYVQSLIKEQMDRLSG